jgi:periodic tryptophan protein 1
VVAPELDEYMEGSDSDDSEEANDMLLRESDRLVLACKNDGDYSTLEAVVFEEDVSGATSGNAYVHHEMVLPAFPLAVEWLDFSPEGPSACANLCAVGTTEPVVEVFNADDPAAVEPEISLEGHSDAVLGLAWNAEYRNVLASASADGLVLVWDLQRGGPTARLEDLHTDKVQDVAWCPGQSNILLSGGFDQRVTVADVRSGAALVRCRTGADVECVAWDPSGAHGFLASSEDGYVAYFDGRKVEEEGKKAKPMWRVRAHRKATTGLALAGGVPGLMATCSTDKTVKLWDISGAEPRELVAQNCGAGALFCCGFAPDSPCLLAAGGDTGEITFWDVRQQDQVQAAFGKALPSQD